MKVVRIFSVIAIAAIVVFGVVSCKDKGVIGVELNKSQLTLEIGETATLVATVLPDNATDKTVTWSSDKPAVATVTEGLVTAKTEGVATITVTTKDGGKTATCVVTVIPLPPPTLNNTWNRGDIVVTISDGIGVFTQINSGFWLTALNNGEVKIGDQKFNYFRSAGHLVWGADELLYSGGQFVWLTSEVRLNQRGDTLTVKSIAEGGGGTYTRVR